MRNLQHTLETPSTETENRMLRNKLAELTAEARHNEETLKRFHDRELALLGAEDLPQLLEILTHGMQKSFRVPCVSLVLLDPDHVLRHLLLNTGVSPEGLHNIFFVDRLDGFNPVYANLARPWLGPMMGDEHSRLFPGCSQLRSLALLPLIRRNVLIGSLNLGSGDPTRFTRHHASDFLQRLATIGAVCVENTANREHLVVSGLTDALTGLHNRRYLERRLEEEIARAVRYGHPLSCLFIDADHFKRVNDLYGHAAGDRALREISLRVKECLRASDVATRFGGEEFALLLPQTDAQEAFSLAERIRKRILAFPIPLENADPLPISVSIGVSELDPDTEDDPGQKLIIDADRALYQAKNSGRNRVTLCP
jgi:diguanylate cyclase (GGDEF)-like protein